MSPPDERTRASAGSSEGTFGNWERLYEHGFGSVPDGSESVLGLVLMMLFVEETPLPFIRGVCSIVDSPTRIMFVLQRRDDT
jgi:hypothetical protein